MKFRTMIEYARRGPLEEPRYEPIGVWVQGPGPGLDLEIVFLPGNEEAEDAAMWVINRLVEAGVKTLQPDFLEYHQETMSPYEGVRGEIRETDECGGAEACARAILAELGERNLHRG
jgi:hypothetical protein